MWAGWDVFSKIYGTWDTVGNDENPLRVSNSASLDRGGENNEIKRVLDKKESIPFSREIYGFNALKKTLDQQVSDYKGMTEWTAFYDEARDEVVGTFGEIEKRVDNHVLKVMGSSEEWTESKPKKSTKPKPKKKVWWGGDRTGVVIFWSEATSASTEVEVETPVEKPLNT